MKKIVTVSIAVFIALVYLTGCGEKRVSFIVASDLHFDGTPEKFTVFDTVAGLINNSFPLVRGISENKIPKPFGIFLTGDLTDDGKQEHWDQFVETFGLNGEGKVKLPVYESFGNHDGNIDGIIRTGIRERNLKRRNIFSLSENGLHYAVKKGGKLFIVLGSYPGGEWDPNCEWCHYFKETFRDPEGSLGFLEEVMAKNLNGKKLPVYLFFHYGWDGFSKLWWTEEEQERFRIALEGADVRAIFHGHNHATEAYQWEGVDVFISGSPQRGQNTGSFLFVNAGRDDMEVFVISNDGAKKMN